MVVCVVMVMSVAVGVAEDVVMVMHVAVGMAVLKPGVVVAAGQTVVMALLACLEAHPRVRLRGAARQARGRAIMQGAGLLPALAHIWTILMV